MSTNLKIPSTCYIEKNNLIISEEIEHNFINIDGIDFAITDYNLKGGNSYILFLSNIIDDKVENIPSLVMKICKSPKGSESRKLKRFAYEIEALNECKNNNVINVINILGDGVVEINKRYSPKSKPQKKAFNYYLMEFADEDLTTLIENKRLELIDKIELCLNIIAAFKQLHDLKFYHRDIKSDNILFCNGDLKIGDLGLAEHQDEEKSIDLENEKIGPYGWLSPEVMNKVLTEKKDLEFTFDCKIDFKSDIFQLGKMFWYVFQANLPIGNVNPSDFEIKDEELFLLIKDMLQYSKEKRPELDIIKERLLTIHKKHSIP